MESVSDSEGYVKSLARNDKANRSQQGPKIAVER